MIVLLLDRTGAVVGETTIDKTDADFVLRLAPWRLHSTGYAYKYKHRKMIYLHRLVAGLDDGDSREVDHVNRNKLDNRRKNLRVVSHQQNMQNTGARAGSSSSFRGVSSVNGRWRAAATQDGRNHHLGLFDTEEEAAAVAARWRDQHMPGAVV